MSIFVHPQVGVDISNIPLDKKQSVQMKEVGGAMMPLWPMVRDTLTYPPSCKQSPPPSPTRKKIKNNQPRAYCFSAANKTVKKCLRRLPRTLLEPFSRATVAVFERFCGSNLRGGHVRLVSARLLGCTFPPHLQPPDCQGETHPACTEQDGLAGEFSPLLFRHFILLVLFRWHRRLLAWYCHGEFLVCSVKSRSLVCHHRPLPSSRFSFQCLLHRGELEIMFEMDRVGKELGDSLTVLEASALSGLNVKAMMDWTKKVYGF